ncbi:MAG: amidase [Pseudomonadota bacterium]
MLSFDLELCYMPAVRQLECFRSGELSPVDVLRAQIGRAEAVEPLINAFTETFFDQALDAAHAAERIYTNYPDEARPLEGLTIGIKDEMPVIGQRNTQGSLIYKDYVADFDHPIVARLRDAGGIFHARTTTPEFSCAWITSSRLHGTTRTPWHLDFTCSGSSGGAAASLAAGTSTLATGSDIAGSIRGPAAACGVVGYKPPYGRNPDLPPFNLDPYNQSGPLARTVADCALFQNVMSGCHPEDIATLRDEVDIPLSHKGVRGLRIAYTLDVGNKVVAPEVEHQTRRVLDHLADQGAIIEEVDLKWDGEVLSAARDYLDHTFGYTLVREAQKHPDLVCAYTAYLAGRAHKVNRERYLRAFEVSGEMYRTIGPVLERCHALVCPTFVTHEIKAEQQPWETVKVKGRAFDSDYEFTLTSQFNMLGRLPVLAVPAGIAPNGLPVGIQIVGRSYDDTRVFRVASALESAAPWLDCPERRPPLERGTWASNQYQGLDQARSE